MTWSPPTGPWFTDPLFGNLGNYEGHRITPELPTQVYRVDPKAGRATVSASGMGGPDGIAFSPDEKRLYIVDTGVRCYAPNGDLIGKIHIPETCANLCFGGKKKNRLFMCGSTSMYAVYVETVGAQVP